MEKSYGTVLQEAEASFVEKRSRFIGRCRPVATEEEAQDFIAGVRKRHWDAAHNVWAYVLRDGAMRYSDDGEPQGRRGQPALNVLLKRELTDCAVVITRYFGGILAGRRRADPGLRPGRGAGGAGGRRGGYASLSAGGYPLLLCPIRHGGAPGRGLRRRGGGGGLHRGGTGALSSACRRGAGNWKRRCPSGAAVL